MATGDEDAAKKKDTDCVYFLASPLTCKKGNDCEFRHSESARLNPRDCWFWLQGQCLNRDCAFRHPPVEGRPAPSPLPASANNSVKSLCYYYSQGYCAKGDKCPFLHGKSPVVNSQLSTSQKPTRVSIASTAEAPDKRSARISAVAPSTLTVKLASTPAKPKPQVSKPSNVWRLSAELQTGVLAPDSKPLKVENAQPLSPKGGGIQVCKRLWNASGKDLPVRGENIRPQIAMTWSRQEHSLLGKEQNAREQQERLKNSNSRFDSIDDGPEVVPHHKDSLLRMNEEIMQVVGKERRVSRRLQNPVGKNSFDNSQDPGLFEGRSVSDTRVLYDGGGSGEDDDQQHGYGYASNDRVQHIRYSDAMASAQGFVSHDWRRTRQDSLERKGSVEREGRVSAGVHDLRNHLVKRRRLDETQPSSENRSRVHLYENSHDNLRQGRQPHGEYSVDTYEQRLSVTEGTRSISKRSYEIDTKQGGKMHRRPSNGISDNLMKDTMRNSISKSSSRMQTVHEHSKSEGRGNDDIEVTKRSESSALSEQRGSVPRFRKSEVRKEVSEFAGPKSLAQIKADKENMGVEKTNGTRGSFATMQSEDGHGEFPEDIRSRIQVNSSIDSPLAFKDESFLVDSRKSRHIADTLKNVPISNVDLTSSVVVENGKQNESLKRDLQSVASVDEHSRRHFVKEQDLGTTQAKVPCVSHSENLQSDIEDGEVTSFKLRALGKTEVTKWNKKVMESQPVSANNLVVENFSSDAEQGNAENSSMPDNGMILETLNGDVYVKEHRIELHARNFEAFHGEPGDEITMAEEEENDDFAKKLRGYFS
ncbi:hypothetical protein O6H91_Y199100 [Diphasiastrum complanatum]|nr:hypothetical protein O6H91_Y199100 [Diphasiastrum complanatum]